MKKTLNRLALQKAVAADADNADCAPLEPDAEEEMPATWGECKRLRMWEPFCPWVRCRHNNYLTVGPAGNVQLTIPGLEVWEHPVTCTLAKAEEGAQILEGVGKVIGLTRERIRQLEMRAMAKAAREITKLDKEPST